MPSHLRRLGETCVEPAAEAVEVPRPAAVPGERRVAQAGTVGEIVDRAVARTFAATFGAYEGPSHHVQRLVRLEFQSLLRSEGRAIRGLLRKSFLLELQKNHLELLRSRDQAVEELRACQDEIERLEALAPPALSAPADPAADLDQGSEADPEVEPARPAAWEAGIRALLAAREVAPDASEEILAAVRRAIEADRPREHALEIDRYRRRIAKLRQSLERTETLLREFASARTIDPGMSSIFREVQGLSEHAAFATEKRAMLAAVYEANVALRAEIERRRDEPPRSGNAA